MLIFLGVCFLLITSLTTDRILESGKIGLIQPSLPIKELLTQEHGHIRGKTIPSVPKHQVLGTILSTKPASAHTIGEPEHFSFTVLLGRSINLGSSLLKFIREHILRQILRELPMISLQFGRDLSTQ